ncbi:MAG: hypothetical protein R3A79_22540 [Nannocystaceae bacterium]
MIDLETALYGALLGALVGAVAGFLAAALIQLGKGLRNRIMARRGAGLLKDMVFPRLLVPGGVLGLLLGASLAPFVGLVRASAGAAAPPLLVAVIAIAGAIRTAYARAPIDGDGPREGA